ncbi:MAG: HDOD domain-containing protein [Gammaproteobacteria bacterium]|nr:HDOD domain-containing protein [Gammaproteobacteria bacterium]
MGIDILQLPLPQVSPSGVQLLEALSTDDIDFKDLEVIISKDPTLASSIIKYANSPLYHRHSKISNVQTALGLLGIKNIRSAVVMAIMRSDKTKQNNTDELIWKHCESISMLCRHIAKVCAPKLADDMQFIGLIHDIGMLVLNHYDAKKYEGLIKEAQLSTLSEKQGDMRGKKLDLLEEQAFGISHDVVTVRVCDHFRFVEQVGFVIDSYHAGIDFDINPETDPEIGFESKEHVKTDVDRMIYILSLAHHLESQIVGSEYLFTSTIPFDYDRCFKLLCLDESLVSQITKQCQM